MRGQPRIRAVAALLPHGLAAPPSARGCCRAWRRFSTWRRFRTCSRRGTSPPSCGRSARATRSLCRQVVGRCQGVTRPSSTRRQRAAARRRSRRSRPRRRRGRARECPRRSPRTTCPSSPPPRPSSPAGAGWDLLRGKLTPSQTQRSVRCYSKPSELLL